MDDIQINNKVKQKLSKKVITKTVEDALAFCREEGELSVDVELSVVLVDPKEIKELNSYYRKKDEETDILSFCYENDFEKIAGEVVLCPEVIERWAKEDKKEYQEEFAKNLIHGILHVLGFEHGSKMFSLQKKALTAIMSL